MCFFNVFLKSEVLRHRGISYMRLWLLIVVLVFPFNVLTVRKIQNVTSSILKCSL